MGESLTRLMPYCSPEQIRGEAMDLRSNQFTLGADLYEMVTGRKAFDADDPVVLVNQIENEQPPEPSKINGKVKPALSALVLRALAEDPGERYATARELVEDLENCEEAGKECGGSGRSRRGRRTRLTRRRGPRRRANLFLRTGARAGWGHEPRRGRGRERRAGLRRRARGRRAGLGALSGGSSAGPTVASSQPKAAAAKAGAGAFAIPNPFAAEELTADLGGQSGARLAATTRARG